MTVASQSGHYLSRPSSASLAEVIGLILDKGLVIDVYARVSLVGIEILTVDARVVVASVDTYLRFAEAVNRLDIARSGTETHGLPGLMKEVREGGAQQKTKGVLEGVKDTLGQVLAGPVFDQECLLTADLALAEITRGKYDFDVAGHYARPDVFCLHVNEPPPPPVVFDSDDQAPRRPVIADFGAGTAVRRKGS